MRLSEVEAAFEPGNPRKHDVPSIAASIQLRGFNAPPMLNEATGRLVYGHGRTKGARKLFEDAAPGSEPPDRIHVSVDGEWMIPVIRGVRFRSVEEAEEYLLGDNRTTELGGWEIERTAKILERIRARNRLAGLGWTSRQVDRLLAKVRGNEAPKETPIPDVEGDPGIMRGEIWALGNHRVMCGDSLNQADLDRLLGGKRVSLTINDPPFAIYGSSSGIGTDIADTKMVAPFFRALCQALARVVDNFGHIYICCDWRSYPVLALEANGARLAPKNLIVWDKGNGLGSMYALAHELIGFWSIEPPAKAMRRTHKATGHRTVMDKNVMQFNRPAGAERLDNAAKPIPLLQRLIRNSSDPGHRVLDMFSGSGSVLIACEREGRVCLAMDIEPRQVLKTIRRWELATGKRAERVDTGSAT